MHIAYLRVSTTHQDKSGLGLEAQRKMVATYQPIAEYVEVESGRKLKRPQLQAALDHCKRVGATLVVAKLDRLARNVEFISRLLNSGVEFKACDVPTLNRFTIHVLAAVAEEEARLISERTKASLAVLKSKGVKLGGARPNAGWSNLTEERKQDIREKMAKERYAHVMPIVKILSERGEGATKIARELNKQGFKTHRNNDFTPETVQTIINYA